MTLPARHNPHVPAAATYSAAQLRLIADTVARDLTPQEFDLFVTVARNTGLDPFRKQIMALVFSKDDEKKRRVTYITGIDGLRAIAARSNRYRPDDQAPRYTYNEALKNPDTNPLGIESCEVAVFMADARSGEWHRVIGIAYWDEFAPIKEEWAWGEDHTGKRRRAPTGKLTLDGNWPKMGRHMIAKCSEAVALRKAFPEETGGLYEFAELDRAQIIDVTPTEIIEQDAQEKRLQAVGAAGAIMFQLSPTSALEPIPLGQVADRILAEAKSWENVAILDWFTGANTFPMREFWARAKGDALAVKQALDARRAELAAQREGEA